MAQGPHRGCLVLLKDCPSPLLFTLFDGGHVSRPPTPPSQAVAAQPTPHDLLLWPAAAAWTARSSAPKAKLSQDHLACHPRDPERSEEQTAWGPRLRSRGRFRLEGAPQPLDPCRLHPRTWPTALRPAASPAAPTLEPATATAGRRSTGQSLMAGQRWPTCLVEARHQPPRPDRLSTGPCSKRASR